MKLVIAVSRLLTPTFRGDEISHICRDSHKHIIIYKVNFSHFMNTKNRKLSIRKFGMSNI